MWNLKKSPTSRTRQSVGDCQGAGDVDQRAQVFTYKWGKFWVSNGQHGDYNKKYILETY